MEFEFQQYAYERDTRVEPWLYWEDYFSDLELDLLQNLAKLSVKTAKVGGGINEGRVNNDIRRTLISWLHNDNENEWVYKKLSDLVINLNKRYYNFNLTGFNEPMQLANYTADVEGTYNWHIDGGGVGTIRKLSIVVQLSYPQEYEGGELQLMIDNNNPTCIKKKRGMIVMFPSWVIHRVTPVTYGTRQSLVQWVNGPEFV
jgi:PKHD-type hydroxylase